MLMLVVLVEVWLPRKRLLNNGTAAVLIVAVEKTTIIFSRQNRGQ